MVTDPEEAEPCEKSLEVNRPDSKLKKLWKNNPQYLILFEKRDFRQYS